MKPDFELPQRPVHLVKCEECGRVFNVNDGDWHVYDVDLGIYLCCKECVAFSPELTYHILSYQASVTYYSTNVIEIQICFTDTLCMRNMVKSFLYFLYIFYVFVHCKFCNTTGLFFVIFFSAP